MERRDFLKTTAVAGGALGLPSLLRAGAGSARRPNTRPNSPNCAPRSTRNGFLSMDEKDRYETERM